MKIKFILNTKKKKFPLGGSKISFRIEKEYLNDFEQLIKFFRTNIRFSKSTLFLKRYVIKSDNNAILMSFISSLIDIISEHIMQKSHVEDMYDEIDKLSV